MKLAQLANAVHKLREGLDRHLANPEDEQLRDGLVQRFEFTYELSHKLLRRHLELTLPSDDLISMADFSTLIRIGCEQGLLRSEWARWKQWRSMRGKTSHMYDEDAAREVVEGIPGFLSEAEALLAALSERHPRG